MMKNYFQESNAENNKGFEKLHNILRGR